MKFASPLTRGTLLRRYKRFMADVRLETGEVITAACANTGAMLGLTPPDAPVWLSRSSIPTRKYPHTWELVDIGGLGLVGINTAYPNRIVEEAVGTGLLPALEGYDSLRREVKYGKNSRIDLLLESAARPPFYVEVKNAHLFRRDGFIEFPDCVTERGTKHLGELARAVRQGARAAMVYLVQADVDRRFTLAGDLDPNYLKAFRRARRAGVEAFALCCKVTPEEITACRVLPVEDP